MRGGLTPEQFLAGFPVKTRSIALALRELVKIQIPDVQEAVYSGWKLIGYRANRGRRSVYFAYIAPAVDGVTLGFEYGILISDPQQLLEGEGSQVRKIRFSAMEQIDPEKIAPLISQALEVATLTKQEKEQRYIEVADEMEGR